MMPVARDQFRRLALVACCALMTFGALSACNLSDPLTGPRTSGCENDRDCDNHGTCSVTDGVGVCECDEGYEGSGCGRCADGYRQADDECVLDDINNLSNNTNNNTANNSNNSNNMTTPMCEDDEVLLADRCVSDSCANEPCGDGTCEVTGEGQWLCDCPDGSSGIECASCAAGCVNGTCDDMAVCNCDQGWAGAACDTCAPGWDGPDCDRCAANAFGPDCDTCVTIGANEPWWDMAYMNRRALVVFNPTMATSNVLANTVVEHEFNHALNPDATGNDVRVVFAPGNELDRILGFDSAWARTDTRIWFTTQADLPPGGFGVYYLYSNNPTPAAPLANPANVLQGLRGWYQSPNGPIYSAQPLSSSHVSVQIRQMSPTMVEVFFHDEGIDTTAFGEVRFIDLASGIADPIVSLDATMGTPAAPVDVPISVGGPNNPLPAGAIRLEVILNPGVSGENATIYLGDQRVATGLNQISYQVTLNRVPSTTPPPSVFACAPEALP